VLRCHARSAPYRPHLPHPDYDCLYGYGDVELVGVPQLRDDAERTVAVTTWCAIRVGACWTDPSG